MTLALAPSPHAPKPRNLRLGQCTRLILLLSADVVFAVKVALPVPARETGATAGVEAPGPRFDVLIRGGEVVGSG